VSGLLLFRNVLTAELLFAVFLNLAMFWIAGCHLRRQSGAVLRGRRRHPVCGLCGVLQIAGSPGPYRRRPGGRPPRPARQCPSRRRWRSSPPVPRFGASDTDQASVVFVPKTLFCNHLNIVLASDAARHEIVSAAGDRADATMARLAADFTAEPGRWPVLGFFGDACLFDTALDRDLADDTGNAVGAAAAYWRIFLAAVRDRPLAYAGKFVRQMAY